MLKHFFAAGVAAFGFVCVNVSAAAVIVDVHLTDTAQFKTATQTPFFDDEDSYQIDVVGVNFNYGGGNVPGGTTLLGVGFDNINLTTASNTTPPPAGPYVLTANSGPTVPTLTLDFPWTGSDNTARGGAFGVTGTDATVLNSQIGAQVFFYRNSDHNSTNFQFDNLLPNTRMYVQLIGSNFGGGAQYDVTANGNVVGAWTSAPSTAPNGSLFAFDSVTDALGNLDINVIVNTAPGSYGGLAGIMISQQVVIPPVPEPSTGMLLGLGVFGLIRRVRRRSA